MKYYKYIFVLNIIIISSCKPTYRSDLEEIRRCSNYKVSKKNGGKYLDTTIDFYKGVKDLETILRANAILSGTSKKDYKELISDMAEKRISKTILDTVRKQQTQSLINNNLPDMHGDVFNLIFRCFENAIFLNKNLKDSAIDKQKQSADRMAMTGGMLFIKKDLYALIDAIDDTDFKQEIIYRSALVLCLYDNMKELTMPSIKYYNYRNKR